MLNTPPRNDESDFFDTLAEQLYSAVISDVLDKLGSPNQAMRTNIRPAFHGARMVGRAHTMRSADIYEVPPEGHPYGFMTEALDSVPVNGIVIGATQASTRTVLWGELLSTVSRVRGGRGAIVDGDIRDISMIEEMDFPVFCSGFRPQDSLGRGKIISYGEPVDCGGVIVHPGDIIFADADGVVCIPQAVEAEAIRLAQEKVFGENEMRTWLASGRSLKETFDHFQIL